MILLGEVWGAESAADKLFFLAPQWRRSRNVEIAKPVAVVVTYRRIVAPRRIARSFRIAFAYGAGRLRVLRG
jgi:hypothetical protein